MLTFNIADISINVSSAYSNSLEKLKKFSSPNKEKADLVINLYKKDKLCFPKGDLILSEGFKWVRDYKNNISICIDEDEGGEILSVLNVDKCWRTASITDITSDLSNVDSLSSSLGEIVFRNNLLFHEGIVIHSSAIDYNGIGIIFTASSGTGKSTQANLWRLHKGATILNEDRPAIRIIDKNPFVYGTPWSGSSEDFLNRKAPLAAIVILEQYFENKLIKLTSQEAVPLLLPRCFLPYFDSTLMLKALDNIEKILNATSVYLLKCKPDKEAVELVYQCMKSLE